jgi:hypothetical protein
MASRPRAFHAEIRRQGPNLYLEVPATVSGAFVRYAEHGRVRVYGTLEGAEIRANLVPRGGGHWLFVHSGMRAAAGVGRGDRVEVVLRAVPWEVVPLAADARAALRRAGALAAFEALGASQRHELLRWVDVADTAAKRARRLAQLVEQVRGETEPRKPGQAARRRRPLWTCPKCGHRFFNRNQHHSCRRYTLDETFARSRPRVRALFERLRAEIEAIGPVHLQAYRDKVALLVRVRFVAAMPKREWLDVGFWFPERIDSPRFHKVETLTPTDHVHLLRLREEGQLDDELRGWLRRAYAVGEQRHLG